MKYKSSLAGSVEHISNENSIFIPSLMKCRTGSTKKVIKQSEKIGRIIKSIIDVPVK